MIIKRIMFLFIFCLPAFTCRGPGPSGGGGATLPEATCRTLTSCTSGGVECSQNETCIRGICPHTDAVCMNWNQACRKLCNASECPVMESDPVQIACGAAN